MSILKRLVVLALAQFVATLPTVDETANILAERQGGDGTIQGCIDNACKSCPITFETGTGVPQCLIYTLDDLAKTGFTIEPSGLATVHVNVPPLDPGCRIVVRTPVTGDGCGGNVLVAQGATCAQVRIDQTFITLFCCGPGDCGLVGAPREGLLGGTTSTILKLKDKNGNVIEPRPFAVVQAELERKDLERKELERKDLERRQSPTCDIFVPTRETFLSDGPISIVSDIVACGPNAGCSATLSGTVTQGFSLTGSVAIPNAFMIITGTLGVTWMQSAARTFAGGFMFGPGERGNVNFIPVLECVEGYFTGPDGPGPCGGVPDGSLVVERACAPTTELGELEGELRAQLIRG